VADQHDHRSQTQLVGPGDEPVQAVGELVLEADGVARAESDAEQSPIRERRASVGREDVVLVQAGCERIERVAVAARIVDEGPDAVSITLARLSALSIDGVARQKSSDAGPPPSITEDAASYPVSAQRSRSRESRLRDLGPQKTDAADGVDSCGDLGGAVNKAVRFARVKDLLLRSGAAQIAHPGGNLFDHVERVARLLDGWGAEEDVQIAGLSHAFYGTDGFATCLLDRQERRVLAGVIGERAEGWVYLYASCDREAVYPNLTNSGPLLFRDRFSGETARVAERDADVFVELTAANELDIAMVNPDFATEFGAELLELLRGAKGRLSARTWTCCTETLAPR
jgi:hypothetical protein